MNVRAMTIRVIKRSRWLGIELIWMIYLKIYIQINRNLYRTGIFREFWHPMFPVRQLAAQWVLFSQCFGLSFSIWLGEPVLVDPTERMLMLSQILWLHYFKVSEEFDSIRLYKGMVSWLLLYQCNWTQCNPVLTPTSKIRKQLCDVSEDQQSEYSYVRHFITHFFLGLMKSLTYFCPILCNFCCFLAFNTTEDLTSG